MTTSDLTTIDYAILIFYFILIMAIGVVLAKRASQGISSYFLGDRKIPWWAIGLSGTASNFDMTGTMVMISFLYAIGLQGFWVSMRGGMCLPLGVLMIYMGKWLRRSNVMTTAEWMTLRFGESAEGKVARLLSAVSNLVVAMAFLVYFVEGTGKFLSIFLPWTPEICSLVMVGIALVYTTAAGFYGDIVTDAFQECLMLVASIYVGYKAFTLPNHDQVIAFAGERWSEFTPSWTSQPMTWLPNPDVYHLFGLCIMFWIARGIFEGVGGFTGGYMPQRYYATRTDRETSYLTAQWIVLLLFRWMLIVGVAVLGLSIALAQPETAAVLGADPEKTLPVVLGQALPAGLRGIMVAGLIAAAMSTFDSTVNSGVAYWIRDIYQAHLRPAADRVQLMRQSYLATVTLAVVAAILGFAVENINEIWSWITGPLSAGLFTPIILRWYWWRFNGYGFAISTAAGLLTSLGLKIWSPDLPFYSSVMITYAVSFAGGIIGSYATVPTSRDVLERFWVQIRPFGVWRRVWVHLPLDMIYSSQRENRGTVPLVISAVAWHVGGVAGIISLLLHKWTTLVVSGSIFAVLTLTLYFTWFKQLLSEPDPQWKSKELDE